MTKYREGDEVTVRAKVRDVDHFPEIGFTFSNGESPELTYALYLPESQIATHTPKPRELKIGDHVGLDGCLPNARWDIVGVHGDWVWLADAEGYHSSARKSQIVKK